MFLVRYLACFLAFFTAFFSADGQITPPGLDDTRAGAWLAIGLNQKLGNRWHGSFYVGGSRQSNPTDYSWLNKPGISVVDFQGAYRFNDSWQLAGCFSYRQQNRYEIDEPDLRTELRYYMRLYYRHHIKRASITWSFRPEYRTFYNRGEPWESKPLEVRLRLNGQVAFPLNKSKSNELLIANEWLWTRSSVEDRLTTYFRHTFSNPDVIVDAGFMFQFTQADRMITQLAVDIIFIDPFQVGKKL